MRRIYDPNRPQTVRYPAVSVVASHPWRSILLKIHVEKAAQPTGASELEEMSLSEPQPVELVILGASAQLIAARIDGRTDDLLELTAESPVEAGAAVCVREGEVWLYGKVESCEGAIVTVRVRGSSAPDRREFSRVYGAVRARYVVVDGDGELARKRWIQLGNAPDGEWCEPDPFMDFSGSGLKFHDQQSCKSGDTLLMELSVQGASEPFRLTASVIRVDPIPDDERDEMPWEEGAVIPTHTIAVHFVDAPPNAIHALVRFAERIQEAFI